MAYYLKFLTQDAGAPHARGFSYARYLPTDDQPGPWLPTQQPVVVCKRGYHATPYLSMNRWTNDLLFLVEFDGSVIREGDKVAGARMRLVRRVKEWEDFKLVQAATRKILEFVLAHPDVKRVRSKRVIALAQEVLATSSDDTEALKRLHEKNWKIEVSSYGASENMLSIVRRTTALYGSWWNALVSIEYAEWALQADIGTTLYETIILPGLGLNIEELAKS